MSTMWQYQALANAIIEQAEFFHSTWYGILTQVDPDYLIDRLRKEVAI